MRVKHMLVLFSVVELLCLIQALLWQSPLIGLTQAMYIANARMLLPFSVAAVVVWAVVVFSRWKREVAHA